MLRSASKLAGAAAGVAASGPPSQPQCRAQQRSPLYLKEEVGKHVPQQHADVRNEVEEEWLLADLKHALDGDQVVFGYEEINSTMKSVLAFTSADSARSTEARLGRSSTQIQELDRADSEDGSESLGSGSADLYIQAAELQLSAPKAVKEDFSRMLSTLLHNGDVQHACLQALKDDPAFKEILDKPQAQEPIEVPMRSFSLMPTAARQGADSAEEHNGFADLVQNLANGLMRLGEVIKQTALGARDAIGKMLITMGYNVHAFLGQPLGTTPIQEANQGINRKAEMVGNALVTVACAILTLVLVKRVHRIRFV